MNISSLSSTQSLWKFQMNIQKQPAASSSQANKSSAADTAEELLAFLDKDRIPESGTENTAQPASEKAESGRGMRVAGPPPGFMPRIDGSRQSEPKEISKEDLINLQQAIKDSGKAAIDGLDKLISSFDETDSNKNGKIRKDEFKTFADEIGITLPAEGQVAAKGMRGPTHAGHHGPPQRPQPGESANSSQAQASDGYTKDDLAAIKNGIESAIKSIADTLQAMINQFSKTDTDQSGSLNKDELKAFADQNGISIGSGKGHHKASGPTKENLETVKKALEESGATIPDQLTKMINSFDEIDANKDGKLGKGELKTFTKSSETASNTQSNTGSTGTIDDGSATSGVSKDSSASQSKNFSRMLVQQMVKAYGQNTAGRYQSAMTESLADMVA